MSQRFPLRGWTAALVALATLIHAASATAAPEVTSLNPKPDYTTVTWTLPPGKQLYAIEAAASTDTYASGDQKGFFNTAHRTAYWLAILGGFSGRIHLPAGTNYVHIAAYVPGTCSPSPCGLEFSAPIPVEVPVSTLPQPDAAVTNEQFDKNRLVAWSPLQSWLNGDYVEVATDPDMYQSGPFAGAFLDENTILVKDLGSSISYGGYRSDLPFPGGTYWIHIAAFDPSGCPSPDSLTCFDQFTAPAKVVVPSRAVKLTDVGRDGHFITAAWGVSFTVVDFVEIARSPAVYETGLDRGAFVADNVVLSEDLSELDLSYRSSVPLPSGTYYVHVATFSPDTCATYDAPTCFDEYGDTRSLTIPPDPATPSSRPAASPPPPTDKATAFSSLFVGKRQHLRKLFVRAAMAEAGTITAAGSVAVPNSANVYRFTKVVRRAISSRIVRLPMRLSREASHAVQDALRHHRRLAARITITARDRAGNFATEKRVVALEY